MARTLGMREPAVAVSETSSSRRRCAPKSREVVKVQRDAQAAPCLWYRPSRTVRGTVTRTIGLSALVLAGLAEPAQAAEETRVVTGRLPAREWMDWTASVSYLHEHEQGALNREYESADSGGRIGLVSDLLYQRSRDVIQLRGEAGLFKDLSLFTVLSIVASDQRSLAFNQSNNCASQPNGCVDGTNSTTLRDGILPGYGNQFPSTTVFRGPTRRGFEYWGLGANWAVFNQARDNTKPTWILRFETRLSLAEDMRFDPAAPTKNTGVGLGYHQFILSTLVSRHFGPLEPYTGAWVMLPVLTGGSPFSAPGASGGAQKRLGFEAGLEATLWHDQQAHHRVAYELRGQAELRLDGLEQSPLWEALSGDPSCGPKNTAACRPGSVDQDNNGVARPNPGVTHSPSYGQMGGDTGLVIQIGPHARLRSLFGVFWQQSHDLTDGSSGNAVYDVPGRRYHIDNAYSWRILIDGGVVF